MKILMTGGTGLIGRAVGAALVSEGHQVSVMTRNPAKARGRSPFRCEFVEGDLGAGPVHSPQFKDVDAVVHLAGEPIADGRWSDAKKSRLVDSRVALTRHLRESLSAAGADVKIIVSASGVGYYGDRGDEELVESSRPGRGFIPELCVAWENEVESFRGQGTRAVWLRTGMVLSKEGGALPRLRAPFRLGLGGPIAGGRGWTSWIHLDDVVGLYLHALKHTEIAGPVNAVAPGPVRNAEFTGILAGELGVPAVLPLPAFALKIAFGEKATILLDSARVLPRRALETGYEFKFPNLREALRAELG